MSEKSYTYSFFVLVEIARDTFGRAEYPVEYTVDWDTRILTVDQVLALLGPEPAPPDPWEFTAVPWEDLVAEMASEHGTTHQQEAEDILQRLLDEAEISEDDLLV